MVWARRRRRGLNTKGAIAARRARRGKVLRRSLMAPSRTFTEIFPVQLDQGGQVSTNSGGVFRVRFQDIPQAAQYSQLYKQFCIKKLHVMLLPRYSNVDPNNAIGVTLYDFFQTRLAFSIDDTPNVALPASEGDVLESNGAKIVSGIKKIGITCYPKPDMTVYNNATGNFNSYRIKKAVWFNTTNPADVNYSGADVQHGAIRYWLTGNPTVASYVQYDVYFKVTFAMRDPA